MDKTVGKNNMKNRFLLLFIFLVTGSLAKGLTSEEIFLRGNLLYEKGDIKEALKSYQEIDPKGQVVWYNMGNCYYHSKEKAMAVLCWKRAERGAISSSLHDKIEKNMKIVCGKNEMYDKHYIIKFINKALSVYPFFLWQTLFLIFWIIFSMSIIRLYTKRRYFLLICLFFINIILGALLFKKYELVNELLCVVTGKKVLVFSTPDDNSHVMGTVPYSACLNVEEVGEGWNRIKYNSLLGWVDVKNIEII